MAIPAQGDRIEPAGNGPSRRATLLTTTAAVALAMTTAVATGILLPRHAYVASAIIGVEGGQGAMRPALAQAAADDAVSRRVLMRAAANGAVPADALSRAVRAEPGHVPGSLMVRARDADGERAAAMATSVATALVADLEERAQDASRAADAAAALRLAKLQEAAGAAHRRLAELGEDVTDPAATGVPAARVSALRARLDAIHAIMASGNPPLGAGRDVPATIDALQTSYLDLTRQLAKATETLGDKHTTVIGLRDGIKRTAAELSAAWARLAKSTEADLNDAKVRAAAAAKGGMRDASRVGTVEAARAAARAADEAAARALASARDDDQAHYRLIARAPVPALADGLAPPVHLAAAGLAGLVMLLLSLRILRPKASAGSEGEADLAEVSEEPVAPSLDVSEPRLATQTFFEDESALEPASEAYDEPPHAPAAPRHEADASGLREDLLRAALHARAAKALRKLERASAAMPAPAPRRDQASDLPAAMARVLSSIAAITPRDEVPVVMVATNEAGASTMDAVLALGEAAAAAGRRVLLVEGAKARPALAAAVAERAEPALIEVFGDWRVVLRAEAGGGLLYLAPSFRDGARLAEELAESGDTLIADALADEFDLVVIDGDRASEAYELAREADAFLRVGRFASPRDDEHFLAELGAPRHALLGTVAAELSVFMPAANDRPAPVAVEPATPAAAALRAAAGARPPHRAPFVASRKPVASDLRRRAGLR